MTQEKKITHNLKFAIILTASILILEIAGGLFARSLALLADAGHVFMDVFALSLSLLAITLANLPSTETRTYGWHRTEVFAAFLNGLLLVFISLFIFREAYQRMLNPTEVLALPMFIVALIGMGVNIIVAWKLRHHDHHDLNIRSAYLHVLGDLSASVAVVVGAVIIRFTGWLLVDPILSIGIAILIFFGAAKILKESVHILLEGVPRNIKLKEVGAAFLRIPGVKNVHDLHIWSVCSHILSLSCHIEIKEEEHSRCAEILVQLKKMLRDKFGIRHSTIEVDSRACSENFISQDLNHEEN